LILNAYESREITIALPSLKEKNPNKNTQSRFFTGWRLSEPFMAR
jgi:hypothetical protein